VAVTSVAVMLSANLCNGTSAWRSSIKAKNIGFKPCALWLAAAKASPL
jgi:hypothetical protein